MLTASSMKVGTPFWAVRSEVGGYQDGRGRRVGPPLSSQLSADSALPWWAVGRRIPSSRDFAAVKKRRRVEYAVANKRRRRIDCDALTPPPPVTASGAPTTNPVLPLRLIWRHGQWRCATTPSAAALRAHG